MFRAAWCQNPGLRPRGDRHRRQQRHQSLQPLQRSSLMRGASNPKSGFRCEYVNKDSSPRPKASSQSVCCGESRTAQRTTRTSIAAVSRCSCGCCRVRRQTFMPFGLSNVRTFICRAERCSRSMLDFNGGPLVCSNDLCNTDVL